MEDIWSLPTLWHSFICVEYKKTQNMIISHSISPLCPTMKNAVTMCIPGANIQFKLFLQIVTSLGMTFGAFQHCGILWV